MCAQYRGLQAFNIATILDLMLSAGTKCQRLLDALVCGIRPNLVQADEIHSIVGCHPKRLRKDAPREWGVMRFEPFNRLGESSFAGLAAPTLDAALTEVPELFALLMLAFRARHIRLCFLADVAVESAWVGIAGHSACRLALAKAQPTLGLY